MSSEVRRLIGEFRPYSRRLLTGALCLLVATPASLVPNLMWMVVVDKVLVERQLHLLIPALATSVGVYCVALFFGMLRDRCFERVGQEFVRDLRRRLFRKLLHQSPGWLHSQRSGDLQSRVISDVDAVQSSLISGFVGMLEELYTFTLVIATIAVISPLVGGSVLAPLIICFFIARHFNSRMKRLYAQARETLGEVGARLQEMLGGFLVIKAFNRTASEEEVFSQDTDRYYKKSLEAVYLRTRIFPIIFSFAFSTNVIMLGLGAWLVYHDRFTLGGLVALRGFWWQLNSPVRTLAQVNDLLQRALAAAGRIYQVLDAPVAIQDPPDAATLTDARQPIRFDNVDFQYASGAPVLRGLNTVIQSGEIVALAGASGAGKSTFLNLLARFYDPTSGALRIGDKALTEITQDSWRQHLGFVLQETFLFNATVLENLRYGKTDASMEQVREAARLANADAFIRTLPQGYDTMVGERGVKLSGGQRQRLGVARAFLSNPEILILDEPTSSVEPESERIIQESLLELMHGRTVVLCSHRPSLLRRAHRVLFLQNGRIAEEGPHDELVKKGGAYAAMIAQWDLDAEV